MFSCNALIFFRDVKSCEVRIFGILFQNNILFPNSTFVWNKKIKITVIVDRSVGFGFVVFRFTLVTKGVVRKHTSDTLLVFYCSSSAIVLTVKSKDPKLRSKTSFVSNGFSSRTDINCKFVCVSPHRIPNIR